MIEDSTLLFVDDQPELRLGAQKLLSKSYVQVFVADGAKQTLEMMAEHEIDLVISDVQMPEMDGFELCKAIKYDDRYQDVRVLLVTAFLFHDFLIKGIEAGADGFLTRPYSEILFLQNVEELLSKPAWSPKAVETKTFLFEGESHQLPFDFNHITHIVLGAFKGLMAQHRQLSVLSEKLESSNAALERSKVELNKLLSNALPAEIAEEMTLRGWVQPKTHDNVAIMFTDFVGFTKSTEKMKAADLVRNLEFYFAAFDEIIRRYGLTKIKTIGDSYFVVAGAPSPIQEPELRMALAGCEIIQFIQNPKDAAEASVNWSIRLGINTGAVVAGIIGNERLAYDVWGKTVNVASRVEGQAGTNQVWITEACYAKLAPYFDLEKQDRLVEGAVVYRLMGLKKLYRNGDSPYLANPGMISVALGDK